MSGFELPHARCPGEFDNSVISGSPIGLARKQNVARQTMARWHTIDPGSGSDSGSGSSSRLVSSVVCRLTGMVTTSVPSCFFGKSIQSQLVIVYHQISTEHPKKLLGVLVNVECSAAIRSRCGIASRHTESQSCRRHQHGVNRKDFSDVIVVP